VKAIRIYFEGDDCLRPGFRIFLRQIDQAARASGLKLLLVSAGTGDKPIRDYETALKSNPDLINVLLLDSESPLGPDCLRQQRLQPFDQNRIFWMVQLMEAWFLADPDALSKYYKKDFRKDALRGNPRIEEIPKVDIEAKLKQATRETGKGSYHKTDHAPGILALLDPERVRHASPACNRLFDQLLEILKPVVDV
jgi:hypothetical protein